MKEQLVGITELRDHAKALIEQVEVSDLVVLRRNRPVARIIPPDRLEQLIDRIEDLEDALSAHGIDPDEVRWESVDA